MGGQRLGATTPVHMNGGLIITGTIKTLISIVFACFIHITTAIKRLLLIPLFEAFYSA